jgi:hypothetical protein
VEAKPLAQGEATTCKGAGESESNGKPITGTKVEELECGKGSESKSNITDTEVRDFVRLIGPDYFDVNNEIEELSEINELWVQAKVQGEEIMFCLDTGASRMIMKSEQYLLIPKSKRPKLMSKNVVLRQADGTTFQIDGVAYLNVQVGGCSITLPVYVAPVNDNLLGLNFLRKACAKIDIDKLQLVIGD